MRAHAIRTQIRTELEESLRQSSRRTGTASFCSSATPPGTSLETVPTGIQALDQLTGGLPRGRITEVLGTVSSGRTSLMLSAFAQTTGRYEVCGVVDPTGAFDPASAARLGVDLRRLLWVRTGLDIAPTLKTIDLLLQGGGFGFIGVDLSEFPPSVLQRVPLATWFRLQRAIEHTPTILLFLSNSARARTTAPLVLRFQLEHIAWSPRLLCGLHPSVEIVRSKLNLAPELEEPQNELKYELNRSTENKLFKRFNRSNTGPRRFELQAPENIYAPSCKP